MQEVKEQNFKWISIQIAESRFQIYKSKTIKQLNSSTI